MNQVKHAVLLVEWHQRDPEPIAVQYNPTEISLDKQVQIAEMQIPGLNAPLQQFVRGQAEKLTLDLFFDTSDSGMGKGAVSVITLTDRIYQLIRIEPTRHAPPLLTFFWNSEFPGSHVGAGPSLGNQRRNGFRCVMESIRQKFTLFSSEGVPLRATLSVALREYATLRNQLDQLKLSSPDRTHAHVLREGESLAAVANRHYDKPADWRAIGDANHIDDPRRLVAGMQLRVPRLVPGH